jgi:hypothetical protein
MKLVTTVFAILVATAAQAQDTHAWQVLTPKGVDALLVYGTPATGDALLSFRCTPKSGQVQMEASLLTREPVVARPASVVLTSEAASMSLRGKVQPSAVNTDMLALAEFSTRAPLVAAFRKTGQIGVGVLGGRVEPPPAPKGMVRKFFGACK